MKKLIILCSFLALAGCASTEQVGDEPMRAPVVQKMPVKAPVAQPAAPAAHQSKLSKFLTRWRIWRP